ncbi:PucR family transcriptional regulator [Kutzneria sp. CA-103260]|uniref:PucR family transcriptional regulator n=1 Tax=Kutzneria sp. CA-103260 TaxID=2802641 RepID=UPI001BA8CEFF|nr:helix-turn-helix domain-containing protein [Kutzneria sp. CA-103260]QUQ64709.1 PucR family transcriptional regulator [Kutzneria sp. CA-103260]
MADGDLQSIVDELAERLRRSVAIDDPSIRLLAASRHFGDEDPLRVASVLNRSVEPEVADRVFAAGIAGWTTPGLVETAGALPRLCAPVRCNGLLLGYLWLIDQDGAFTEDETSAAAEAAASAGAVLYRRLLLHERSKARHEAILRELVSSDADVRVQAMADLRAEQLFADDRMQFTVVAVQCPFEGAPQEVAFEAAVEDGVRAVTDDVALMVANRSRSWILLVQRRPPSHALVASIVERVTTRFRRLTGGEPPVFGLGGTVDRLDDVITSYQQALLAARAAGLTKGGLARWGELGPYEILLRLPADVRVAALDGLDQTLVDTLTEFFDHAGNIQRTADALSIHRATLYQRLKRIEQLTGCSLDRGDDRLTLHIGLKLRAIHPGAAP